MLGIDKMIELKNIKKIYKAKKTEDTIALNNISTSIPSKGLVFIVGASGSGKSTLLNCLGGLDKVDSGSIIVDNIDITKLSEHDLDKFRNSFLGFVFQDYNIIEDYNVFENVNLSLELQGKNDSKLVSSTLNSLGLEGLEKRNINELSGGQKQRVAIARALVKNPSLILADEPTGNLDSKSSKQIFEILKNISKDRTVLVVSHDREMAKSYGDIIIEISDGNIIKETKRKTKEENKKEVSLKQFHISRKNILKLTFGNIKAKMGKFIFTIILLSFAFFFMEFAFNAYLFKSSSLASDTMHRNNDFYFNIGKQSCAFESGEIYCKDLILDENDVKELERATKHKLNRVYMLKDGSDYLTFKTNSAQPINEYYTSRSSAFVSVDDDTVLTDLVGSKPNTKKEIVISQREAEFIVKYGIIDSNNGNYQPENLNDLINDKKEVKLGNTTVIITGYIKLNDHTLDEFKDKENINNDNYKDYFNNYIDGHDEYFYVTKDFIKEINLTVDYNEILKDFEFVTREFGDITYLHNYQKEIMNGALTVLTKEGTKIIDSLKENEIIVPISALEVYSTDYKSGLEKFYKEHPKYTYEESVNAYTIEYLNKNRFIEKKFYTERLDKLPSKDVKIIGIVPGNKLYVSQQLLEYFKDYNKILITTRLYESSKEKIKYIFDNLELDSEYYTQRKVGVFNTIDYKFIRDISTIKMLYEHGKGYIAVITAVFILFAILLFYNFIATTITYSKKKIGILRAIGTSHKDVGKIFSYESLIIGVLSTIISIMIWIPVTKLVNRTFNYTNLLNINYIVIEPETTIITFISVMIGSLLLTGVCLSRLAHIKPIDAILDK